MSTTTAGANAMISAIADLQEHIATQGTTWTPELHRLAWEAWTEAVERRLEAAIDCDPASPGGLRMLIDPTGTLGEALVYEQHGVGQPGDRPDLIVVPLRAGISWTGWRISPVQGAPGTAGHR